jgi:hypothetical protein
LAARPQTKWDCGPKFGQGSEKQVIFQQFSEIFQRSKVKSHQSIPEVPRCYNNPSLMSTTA